MVRNSIGLIRELRTKEVKSVCLFDCMNELFKSNIRGKLYRLIFKMNEETCIEVQTPVGMTEKVTIGETVGQGTIEGAVISAVNLHSGIRDFFLTVR